MALKVISKCVLIAAVASLAVAGSVSTSFAAKKKKAAVAAACVPGTWKGTTCGNGWCTVSWCGVDGKWYAGPGVCWQPFCPK